MATVNLGSIKFKWKGTYAAGTAYTVDDVVSYNGSSYICISATTGNLPTVTAKWEQMSSAGTNGTDVGTVITTQGDMLYRDGSGLQRLAKGTANQQLRINSGATAPEWFTSQGGAILQAKIAQYFGATTVATTSSGVDVSTLHSDYDHVKVDITPASTSSKFLVQIGGAFASNSSNYGMFYLRRGIASSNETTMTGGRHVGNGSGDSHNFVSTQFFDAPNTTSVVNYRLFARKHSSNQIMVNDLGSTDSKGGGLYIHVYEYDGSIVTITDS